MEWLGNYLAGDFVLWGMSIQRWMPLLLGLVVVAAITSLAFQRRGSR